MLLFVCMTLFSALSTFLFFILSQVYLEKGKKPNWLMNGRLYQIMLAGFFITAVSILISILTWFILIGVWGTVVSASMIAWKYRTQFERLEKGEAHV